jgi:hypothetical protein
MARSHARSDPDQPQRRSGAGPWAALVLALVVVTTGALTLVLVNLPQGGDPTNALTRPKMPFPPNFKMPSAPPMPRG